MNAIPRTPYAVVMSCATIMALGLSVLVATTMGSDGESLLGVGLGVLSCAAVMVIPMMGPPLVTADRWGLVVLGCTGVRMMIGLGAMLLLSQAFPADKKAVVYALLTGTMTLIASEGMVAVWLLARRDALSARSRMNIENSNDQPRIGTTETGQMPRSTT